MSIDEEVAQQAARLQRETEKLERHAEITFRNIRRALNKLALIQRTAMRRN